MKLVVLVVDFIPESLTIKNKKWKASAVVKENLLSGKWKTTEITNVFPYRTKTIAII